MTVTHDFNLETAPVGEVEEKFREKYRLIPGENGTICNTGYEYVYTNQTQDGGEYNVSGTCQRKQCSVQSNDVSEPNLEAGIDKQSNPDDWYNQEKLIEGRIWYYIL